MELIALIAVLWLIGCLFPSGGEPHYGPGWREVVAFIVGVGALLAAGAGLMAGAAFISDWLGDVMLFPFVLMGLIATPMVAASIGNYCADRAARR